MMKIVRKHILCKLSGRIYQMLAKGVLLKVASTNTKQKGTVAICGYEAERYNKDFLLNKFRYL